MSVTESHTYEPSVRDRLLRWSTAGGLLVVAGAHGPVVREHLEEAPYMGVAFLLFISAALLVQVMVLIHDTPRVYVASLVLCVLAIAAYVATRLVAFPLLADEVGNWLEPWGVVSVLAEAVVAGVSVLALHAHAR